MPPKKRKQPTLTQRVPSPAAAQNPEPNATAMTTRGKQSVDATAASSRSKRAAVAAPSPPGQPATKKVKTGGDATSAGEEGVGPKRRGRPPKNAVVEEEVGEAPKRRGRPPKNAVVEEEVGETPKRRGRPPKNAAVKESAVDTPKARGRPPKTAVVQEDEGETPKRRGRPPKNAAVKESAVDTPRARGRPPKNATPKSATPLKAQKANKVEKPRKAGDRKSARLSIVPAPDTELPPVKRRGRKATATVAEEDEEEAEEEAEDDQQEEQETAPPTRRGRGRPPKKAVAPSKQHSKLRGDAVEDEDEHTPHRAHYHLEHIAVEKQLEDELADSVKKAPKRRGRKPKKAAADAAAVDQDDEVDVSNDANITEATTIRADLDLEDDDTHNYWLMKAEPESRVEKNANGNDVDSKFTIDDLRSKDEPEPWDGIRNYQAQKNLRAMKTGDLAFFYESNCKKPGVVGIMEIVREATPDMSAFSKDSIYYDPNSDPGDPKWMVVHVEFRRKFAGKVPLKQLQTFSKDGGVLAGMGLFKQSRLSVSAVSPDEWAFILSLADNKEPEDRMEDTDLGNDFATAFEAPPNLGSTKRSPTPSNAPVVVEKAEDLVQPPDSIQTTADAAPALSAMTDFESELVQAAETPLTADLPAFEEPTLPTVEEPTISDIEIPASSGNSMAPPTANNNLGVRKPQSRSVSRGRSKQPVSRTSSRAASRASTAKPGSRAGSRAGSKARKDDVEMSVMQQDTIIEEDSAAGAVDGDVTMT